ncbi:hypothetical protein [Micromonospora sp. DT31]|uniref:hypothetical protein n=1 Tax=Micromonospora sp. DT31 TaxID=3393434 RepID=UPI003CF61FB9
MIRLIESLGDRVLSLVVPKTTATAAAACTQGWGAYCSCPKTGSYLPYYKWCRCVNGVRSCTCQPRSGLGTCRN